jgi:hypothetical protein
LNNKKIIVSALLFAALMLLISCKIPALGVEDIAILALAESANHPSSLGVPANLTATNTLADAIQISWNAVNNARFYNVYRSDSPAGPFELIGENNIKSYNDEEIIPGQKYYYRVAAGWRSAGIPAAEVLGRQSDPEDGYALLGAAAAVTASINNATKVTVQWSAVAHASTYRVLRSLSETGAYAEIAAGVTGLAYDDTGVVTGKPYYYRVVAYSGESIPGFESAAVMGYACTGGPGNLKASDGTIFSYVKLTWDPAADTSGYEIYRDAVLIATVSTTGYHDTGASADGSAHQYGVVALFNDGDRSMPALDQGSRRAVSLPIPCTVSWSANREKAVNSTGGGYYVYYSASHFDTTVDASRVNVPFTAGDSAPTSATINLGPGTWYFRVAGYSNLGGGLRMSALSDEKIVVIY